MCPYSVTGRISTLYVHPYSVSGRISNLYVCSYSVSGEKKYKILFKKKLFDFIYVFKDFDSYLF